MKIVKLTPAFKEYIWGGTRLKTEYNKKTELETVAESWELSAHKDGESTVDGIPFSQYVTPEMLGKNAHRFEYFPILIKFIDAKDNLSVQVHPDDNFALENEGEYGKTEMWYIMDCDKDSFLYYGFKRTVTKSEYKAAIENGTLCELLNAVPVKKGDVFFIPAGTVHAIGKGILICEIQQNSNTTYRVYDYNRRDKDGNTRPLHIEKALEVSTLKKSPEINRVGNILAECEYFKVQKLTVSEKADVKVNTDSFMSLIIISGNGTVDGIPVTKGDSLFAPAGNGTINVLGDLEIIISTIGG